MNRIQILFAIVFLAMPQMLVAGPTGTVSGQVAAGAVDAVGATVRLTAPGVSRSATTDASGNFQIEGLPPGTYSASARLDGFRKESRAGIDVRASQTTNLDLSLQVQTFAARIEGDSLLIGSGETVELDSRPDLEEAEALLIDGTVYLHSLFDAGAQAESRIYRHQGDPASAELVTSALGNRFNSGLTQVDGVVFSYVIDGLRPALQRLDPLGSQVFLEQNANWGGMHAHGSLLGAYNVTGFYRFWELASNGSFQVLRDFTTTAGLYFAGIFGAQDTIFARDEEGRIYILNVQAFSGFSRVVLTCLNGAQIAWQTVLYDDLQPIGSVTPDIEVDILLGAQTVAVFTTSAFNRANRVDVLDKGSGARIREPVILGSTDLPITSIHSKRLVPVGASAFLAVFALDLGERQPLVGQLIDPLDGSVGGPWISLVDWTAPAFSFTARPSGDGAVALQAGFPISHDLYLGGGSLDSTPVFLGPRPLVFAQFGDGDGLTSRIVLTNPDLSRAAQAVIEMRNPEGEPLVVDFEDGQITLPGSTFEGRLEVEIPAGGSAAFQTDGTGDVLVGSVIVTSSQVLSGVILFGGPTGLAGVGSSQVMLGGLSAPVLESPADEIRTAIAVVNLEDQQVTRLVQISDADGVVLASADLVLPPGGQRAKFVFELFPSLGSFEGTLTMPGEGLIAATVLQVRPNQLATLPVTPFEIP